MNLRTALCLPVLATLGASQLAGCAGSRNFIQPDSARQLQFSVPVSYQEAYRRADAFGRQCHGTTNNGMWSAETTGNIYTDTQTAVLHLRQEAFVGKDFERFDIKGTPSGSDVTILSATNGHWNQHELKVARMSMETGHVTCYGDVPVQDGEAL